MIEVKKLRERQNLLILLFKNVVKISNFEKCAKTCKNLKKTVKKLFCCLPAFTREEKTSLKKGLFYAWFFIFWIWRVFHCTFFFEVASSLSIQCEAVCSDIKRHFWSKNVKNHSPDSNKHTVVRENPSLWLLKTPRKLPVIKACRRLIVVHSIHLDFPS